MMGISRDSNTFRVALQEWYGACAKSRTSVVGTPADRSISLLLNGVAEPAGGKEKLTLSMRITVSRRQLGRSLLSLFAKLVKNSCMIFVFEFDWSKDRYT